MAKTPVPLCFISHQVYFISCGPYHWSLKALYYNYNNNNNNNGCIILEALFYIATHSEFLVLTYSISGVIVFEKTKVT
jgi:hypothetical protein